MLATRPEIIEWMRTYMDIRSYDGAPRRIQDNIIVNDDLSVDICPAASCAIHTNPTIAQYPVQFRNVHCDFYCPTALSSFKGCPSRIVGNLTASCVATTIDYLPETVSGYINLFSMRLTSLHNIHKHVKTAGVLYLHNSPITTSILGVLLVNTTKLYVPDQSSNLRRALNIVDSYIGNDMLDKAQKLILCQQELIDAGLEPFARL